MKTATAPPVNAQIEAKFSRLSPRLRELVRRLGGDKKVADLLRTCEGFDGIGATTISRWKSGRVDETFPKRAKLAIKLLATAPVSSETLRFCTVPHPASLPLVFAQPLVAELDPNSRDQKGVPLPIKETRTIALGLTLKRISIPKCEAPIEALERLVTGNLDLTVVPEMTYKQLGADERKKKVILLCRIARMPTLLLRQGRGVPSAADKVTIIHSNLGNSAYHAKRLASSLKAEECDVTSVPAPSTWSEETSLDSVVAHFRGNANNHVFMFGPTRFLNDVLERINATANGEKPVYFEGDERFTGITNWYVCLNPSKWRLDVVAPLLAALRKATSRAGRADIGIELQKHKETFREQAGLGEDKIGAFLEKNLDSFRCSRLSPRLISLLRNYRSS